MERETLQRSRASILTLCRGPGTKKRTHLPRGGHQLSRLQPGPASPSEKAPSSRTSSCTPLAGRGSPQLTWPPPYLPCATARRAARGADRIAAGSRICYRFLTFKQWMNETYESEPKKKTNRLQNMFLGVRPLHLDSLRLVWRNLVRVSMAHRHDLYSPT